MFFYVSLNFCCMLYLFLDPSGSSELLGSPRTEITGLRRLADIGDGAASSQNNSLLSSDSSSATMKELFNRQSSDLSLVSQTTIVSRKSADSNNFGSDPFGLDKNVDPFTNNDPFASTSSHGEFCGGATATNDIFGAPSLVQSSNKQPNSEPFSSKGAHENNRSNKASVNYNCLFDGGISSEDSSVFLGSGSTAWGAGDPADIASSAKFGFGKCKSSTLTNGFSTFCMVSNIILVLD